MNSDGNGRTTHRPTRNYRGWSVLAAALLVWIGVVPGVARADDEEDLRAPTEESWRTAIGDVAFDEARRVIDVNGTSLYGGLVDTGSALRGRIEFRKSGKSKKPYLYKVILSGPTQLNITGSEASTVVEAVGRGEVCAKLIVNPAKPQEMLARCIAGTMRFRLYDRGGKNDRIDQFGITALKLDGKNPASKLLGQTGRCKNPKKACGLVGLSTITGGDGVTIEE